MTRLFVPALQFGFVHFVFFDVVRTFNDLFNTALVALHEYALLADLDLNGASFTRRVGLLDFRRMPAGQSDLAFVSIGGTVRLAQVFEQARLVRLGQIVILARFRDASRLQLLEQDARRHFEFRGKLGYVVTRHSFLLMQGPIPCG